MRKVALISSTLSLCALSAYAAHFFTKINYLEVGKNYGSIGGSYEVFDAIKKQLPLLKTCTNDQMKNWNVVVAAKTMAVHATPAGDSSLALCSAE